MKCGAKSNVKVFAISVKGRCLAAFRAERTHLHKRFRTSSVINVWNSVHQVGSVLLVTSANHVKVRA